MALLKKYYTKKGEKRYKALIRMSGHPTECATFKRKTDAERWIKKTETAIMEGKYFKSSAVKKLTFGDMVDRYVKDELPKKPKSVQKQTMQLNWWKDKLGKYLLTSVKPSMIAECRDELLNGKTYRDTKRSPSTVNRYIAALSHVYSKAAGEWEWLDYSPVKKVDKMEEPKGRVRWLDDDERARLLKECEKSKNKHLFAIVVLALSTGMRKGEILNLNWKQVDLKRERIILKDTDTKTKKYRNVPLKDIALNLIKQMSKSKRLDSNLLFAGNHHVKPICIREAWRYALKRAKIEDFRFHDTRHSCASYLIMNGASLAEAAEILGHSSIQTSKRYIHLAEFYKSKTVENMNKNIFKGIK